MCTGHLRPQIGSVAPHREGGPPLLLGSGGNGCRQVMSGTSGRKVELRHVNSAAHELWDMTWKVFRDFLQICLLSFSLFSPPGTLMLVCLMLFQRSLKLSSFAFFSFWSSSGVTSTTMSSSLLTYSSALSNWLSIASTVFFILIIVCLTASLYFLSLCHWIYLLSQVLWASS